MQFIQKNCECCNCTNGSREHNFSGWVGLLKLAHSKNTIDKAVSILVLNELFYPIHFFLVRVCSNWEAQKHFFSGWVGWLNLADFKEKWSTGLQPYCCRMSCLYRPFHFETKVFTILKSDTIQPIQKNRASCTPPPPAWNPRTHNNSGALWEMCHAVDLLDPTNRQLYNPRRPGADTCRRQLR